MMKLSIGKARSFAYWNLEFGLRDPMFLLKLYDDMTKRKQGRPDHALEALKRAAFILAFTAWESFIEDRIKQSHQNGVDLVDLEKNLSDLHNPNSRNISRLSRKFLGFDLTEKWNYRSFNAAQCKDRLDHFLKLRHKAVHRMQKFDSFKESITRNEVLSVVHFLKGLSNRTEDVFDSMNSIRAEH